MARPRGTTKPNDQRLQVVVTIRLTIGEHNYLLERYPGSSPGAAVRAMLEEMRSNEGEFLRERLQGLQAEVEAAAKRLRDREEDEQERELEREAEERARETREEAEKVRARWLREAGHKITSWANEAAVDPNADPVSFVESLASENGVDDPTVVSEASEWAKRALARRREGNR